MALGIGLVDRIDMNEFGIRHKFDEEFERHNKFRREILMLKDEAPREKVDVKAYAKHVLRAGTNEEKRELLAFLRGRLAIINKGVRLL